MQILYTVYKITNNVNGKIYIGSHKTRDIDDSYMGSGKLLKYAFKKYGIENFTKEIMYVFDNPDEMYKKEAELVDTDFIKESTNYNLKIGGFGGFDYVNSTEFDNPTHSTEHAKMMYKLGTDSRVKALKEKFNDTEWVTMFSKENSARQAMQYANGRINGFKGKTHTPEARLKLSESYSKRTVIKCPHCGLESKSKTNMMRWHFDKCKQR